MSLHTCLSHYLDWGGLNKNVKYTQMLISVAVVVRLSIEKNDTHRSHQGIEYNTSQNIGNRQTEVVHHFLEQLSKSLNANVQRDVI